VLIIPQSPYKQNVNSKSPRKNGRTTSKLKTRTDMIQLENDDEGHRGSTHVADGGNSCVRGVRESQQKMGLKPGAADRYWYRNAVRAFFTTFLRHASHPAEV